MLSHSMFLRFRSAAAHEDYQILSDNNRQNREVSRMIRLGLSSNQDPRKDAVPPAAAPVRAATAEIKEDSIVSTPESSSHRRPCLRLLHPLDAQPLMRRFGISRGFPGMCISGATRHT